MTNKTLLHLIKISPNNPLDSPFIISSASFNCKFIYLSKETNVPLYSIPHFNLTNILLVNNSYKKGFGFIKTPCYKINRSLYLFYLPDLHLINLPDFYFLLKF